MGAACHFHSRGRHFIDRTRHLQGLLALLVEGEMGGASVLGYLLADVGHLQGELLNALDHAVDGVHKTVESADHCANLIVAGAREAAGQITSTTGNLLQTVHEAIERSEGFVGDIHRKQRNCRKQHQR